MIRKEGCWYMCSSKNTATTDWDDADWLTALRIVGGATLLTMK